MLHPNPTMKINTAFAFFLLLAACPVSAAMFENAYISFEMQDNWKCKLEQTEWVCRASDPTEAKEAVIVLTAKEKGPTDSFSIYENHMNAPINTTTRSGEAMTSTLTYKVQPMKINDQQWLDALHQNSEVKNYYTRYLATIRDQIAILVTFSAHNRFYAKHSANFNKTIQSLKVIAPKDFISKMNSGGGGESYSNGNMNGADALLAMEQDAQGSGGLSSSQVMIGVALLIIAILGFVALRIYQKKNR